MSRRSGLGRGLSSLIPQSAEAVADGGAAGTLLAELDITTISPNPNQPRVHFDEDSLAELAASISHIGVLQPVLVYRLDDGGYRLIAGERRWRAAQRAGLTSIPAVIRSAPEDVALVEQALVENLHRQDLTPLEEAAAYLQLVDDFGLTHDEIAQRVGKNRSTISNTLRLLGLPGDVQRMLADGELSAGHAKALLGAPDRQLQSELAAKIVADGWSVRATEQAVSAARQQTQNDHTTELPRPQPWSGVESDDDQPGSPPADNVPAPPAVPAGSRGDRAASLFEVEQLLEERLDTRVRAELGKRGRLIVEFADLEDLTRIYHIIVGVADQPASIDGGG